MDTLKETDEELARQERNRIGKISEKYSFYRDNNYTYYLIYKPCSSSHFLYDILSLNLKNQHLYLHYDDEDIKSLTKVKNYINHPQIIKLTLLAISKGLIKLPNNPFPVAEIATRLLHLKKEQELLLIITI